MLTYLTREEAEKLVCPFLNTEQQLDSCVVDRCQAWEWNANPWADQVRRGFCGLCHRDGE